MSPLLRLLCLAAPLLFAIPAAAQVPVVPNPNQEQMLASADSTLAANKRLVYDFWREVFEGLHMELAEKYLTETYIQHNPNVPSGRAAFVDFFSKRGQPKRIERRITGPLVSIVAEHDLVVLIFSREYSDPKDSAQKYTTTWFDMFRIENGKIAEHWDPAQKR
jgi:predicted SnoaL-like aldol condensation-catalyzing enzyme